MPVNSTASRPAWCDGNSNNRSVSLQADDDEDEDEEDDDEDDDSGSDGPAAEVREATQPATHGCARQLTCNLCNRLDFQQMLWQLGSNRASAV